MNENGGAIKLQVEYEVNKSSEQKIQNSIDKIKSKSKEVQTAFSNAFSKIGSAIKTTVMVAALAVTTIIAGIARLSSSAMAAYKVQAVAENKLETIMRQRMHATDEEIDRIKELAGEYQKLGLVGDEVAVAGMSNLAMFTSDVKSLEKLMPNFENALVGIYGMEASTGNAQSLANSIGIALSQGKTTRLARLGIVFSEAEQKAFAMANELERADMISAKLKQTFGDVNSELAKTPLGRIQQLKNAFSDVMEILGEAFTNIFASFVPMLQTVVSWLDTLARKLVQISELIYTAFGGVLKKTGGGGVVDGLEEMADGLEDVGGAAGGAKESLASFDNVVQLADSSGGGGSSGSGAFDLTELEFENTALEKTESILDRIGKKIKDSPLFDFSEIKDNVHSIGESISEIFENTRPSAEKMMNSFANSMKTRAIAIFTVGKSIVTAFTGGIAQWLDEGKERISKSWSNIFDNFSEAFDNISEITENIGTLLTDFFSLESVKNTIANAFTAIEETVTSTIELISNLFNDITDFISSIIDENYADIEEFLANVGGLFENASGLLKTIVHDIFSSVLEKYEKYVKPTFDRLKEGTNKIVKAVLGAWNGSILPLLNIVIDSLKKLWSEHIKPFVDKVLDLVGVFMKFASTIYNKVIAPIVGFVMDYMVPYLAAGISMVWGAVEGFVGDVLDAVGGLIEYIKGVIQVIDGLLNGDMNDVVEGLKSIFNGLITFVVNVFSSIVNTIIGALNGLIRAANKIKIPGTDVGVSIAEIPKWEPSIALAEGGIVYKPTDFGGFMAGEAGAEAIVPLQNSGYTKQLAMEIVKGLRDAGFGGGDTYNIENAFGDDRSMERLVNKIDEIKQKKEARKGAVVYA